MQSLVDAEFGQPRQICERGIRDSGSVEVQLVKVGQRFQMHHRSVGDRRSNETEGRQVCQSLQIRNPLIGNGR
jgi:hypothetical protein